MVNIYHIISVQSCDVESLKEITEESQNFYLSGAQKKIF